MRVCVLPASSAVIEPVVSSTIMMSLLPTPIEAVQSLTSLISP